MQSSEPNLESTPTFGLGPVQIHTKILVVCIVSLILFLMLKKWRRAVLRRLASEPQLPKLKRRDFTLEELKKYDGAQEDGRVLLAVNGSIFDVTKARKFYGPGGPYAAFGGRDASRGLATFSVSVKSDSYDDLSDLNTMEMESVNEWEGQFKDKYDLVGRLLKPGQEPRNYSDEEEEPSHPAAGDKPKKE